ncbi:MAG: phosphoribosylglycinamide formyltransferase [Thermoleophilia bacterium]|nr:phosphoribosylglycinamide formyltransferase [Thermoleophilia bacterium]
MSWISEGRRDLYRLAVLASGTGSNLQAIIDKLHRQLAYVPLRRNARIQAGPRVGPTIEVAIVVSDRPDAPALERAERAGICTAVFPFSPGCSREEHDMEMAERIRGAGADLVVLAGYMRLVSPWFVEAFPWRIINLHPALLPAFPGTTSIRDALEYGVKVTGVTVHFVDAGLDTGPIILQEPVRVREGDTPESLATRIHAVEHELLPAAICLLAMGRVRPPLSGGRVVRVDWDEDGNLSGD